MKFPTIVREWLTDFKSDKDGYSQFYLKYFGNKKLYTRIIKCLENKSEVESICHQIYNLALVKITKLNISVLDILPSILSFYLTASIQFDKGRKPVDDNVVILRSCLISVRNILYARFYLDQENTFTIPAYANGSVYHSTIVRPDLDLFNKNFKSIQIRDKSCPQLLPDLIKIYNYHLNNYSSVSIGDFCSLSCQISSLKITPRIPVSNGILLELTNGIFSILLKQSHTSAAIDALTEVEHRANHELMTDVIVAVCSVQNSINRQHSSEELIDCPIVVNSMIQNGSNSINDILITNASFRPEKVSEDIATVKQIVNNDINLSDIGVTIKTNKVSNGVKRKCNNKFTVESPISNIECNTNEIDVN